MSTSTRLAWSGNSSTDSTDDPLASVTGSTPEWTNLEFSAGRVGRKSNDCSSQLGRVMVDLTISRSGSNVWDRSQALGGPYGTGLYSDRIPSLAEESPVSRALGVLTHGPTAVQRCILIVRFLHIAVFAWSDVICTMIMISLMGRCDG